MNHVDDQVFALQLRNGSDLPESEVVLHGSPTQKTLPGSFLEAVLDTGDGFLVFTSDDTPYEEQLGIHLTDSSGALLESLSIGGAYRTGAFRALRIVAPATVAFRFTGETVWKVQVLQLPRFRIPFLGDPSGVCRPIGFRSRLVIQGQPKIESG